MRFIIPPMTVEDAVTSVLNVCMHTMRNNQPWDDARLLLTQLMQDAYEMGLNKANEERATPDTTQEANSIIQIEQGSNVDKLA